MSRKPVLAYSVLVGAIFLTVADIIGEPSEPHRIRATAIRCHSAGISPSRWRARATYCSSGIARINSLNRSLFGESLVAGGQEQFAFIPAIPGLQSPAAARGCDGTAPGCDRAKRMPATIQGQYFIPALSANSLSSGCSARSLATMAISTAIW